ncbi:hypothetical protein AX15_000956 [Amanita polypyramis BW_CC]|nr:hypothetical protein AX15_000956 [Amanita polypyramis BW_CC]
MTSFQMPNVFVVPPEEDHSPAWCYFDAAKRHLNPFSQVQFDSALTSIAPNDATTSGKAFRENSILDTTGHLGNHCVEHDIDYDCEAEVFFEQEEWDYHHQPPHGSSVSIQRNVRELANDSDVIEVVKVGWRALEDEKLVQGEQNERPTEIVRSKTLKSRASKVFHSLKKVGKRRPNKLSFAQDNDPSSPTLLRSAETTQAKEIPDSPKPSMLPRRSSVLLSQLFVTPTGPKSFSHAADHITSSTPLLTTSDCPRVGASLSYEQDIVHDAGPRFPPRAASPSPSFNKRRFSKINLQKLFSFSTTTSSSASTTSSTISGGLTLSSNDDTVLASPSLTSDSHQDQDVVCENASGGFPPDEDVLGNNANDSIRNTIKVASPVLCGHDSLAAEISLNLGSDLNLELGLGLDLPTGVYQLNDCAAGELYRKENGATRRSSDNINFDMLLDSLHFDDLSFDVNKF